MFGSQFFPFGFGLILIVCFSLCALVLKVQRDRARLRLREMAHQERIAAIQHQQQVPALPEGAYDLGEVTPQLGWPVVKHVLLVRLAALGLGLLCLMTGVGMTAGFYFIEDDDLYQMWAVGFIPIFAGVGLLLFYSLTRGVWQRLAVESEAADKKVAASKDESHASST